jgi:hypothetical protein
MKRNKRFLISGLCALILLSVVCATNVFAADEVTITGTVYATAHDDNDNVTAAVIAGSDEEYVIVANAAGKELFKLDLEVVKASGTIGEDGEGNKTITVTKYEVMPESE